MRLVETRLILTVSTRIVIDGSSLTSRAVVRSRIPTRRISVLHQHDIVHLGRSETKEAGHDHTPGSSSPVGGKTTAPGPELISPAQLDSALRCLLSPLLDFDICAALQQQIAIVATSPLYSERGDWSVTLRQPL
ncbi:hypothetical protein RRG08_018580 [Elysia crispata]|uniref:Uncharacterized protein n=1 Tax=Elysia crispata TaxID=231223 RepID=A0AAE1A6I2_9GAST|nr:hypothetical protein RRG08_018580 [Elysia crispata]